MERIDGGSVVSPRGFLVGAARGGIKSVEGQPDVALIVSERPASAAGTFTTNKFAAAPVQWCRRILPSPDTRAVIASAGNANACTGDRGRADVRTTAQLVAELIGCRPEQVCVASTGIIGHPMPMDRLAAGVRLAHAALSDGPEAADLASRAIMTTDTRPKVSAVASAIEGKAFRIGGVAKGSGMIAPHMATLLVFLTTDAAVAPGTLARCLREATDRTLNRITVDGDTSTNDTAIALANGASGAVVPPDGAALHAFSDALETVLSDLSYRIVADGEGATRVIRVEVTGARDTQDAARAARAVAESQLLKCAVAGGDPNWGRIVCAIGYSGAEVMPEQASVHIGRVCVVANGTPTGLDASAEMQSPEVTIRAELACGEADAYVLTCDLTAEYVRINAEYHT